MVAVLINSSFYEDCDQAISDLVSKGKTESRKLSSVGGEWKRSNKNCRSRSLRIVACPFVIDEMGHQLRYSELSNEKIGAGDKIRFIKGGEFLLTS